MKLKLFAMICGAGLMIGCDRSAPSNSPPAAPTPPKASQPPAGHKEGDGHDHKEGDGHDHDADKHDDADKGDGHAGHGGEMIELGTEKIGELTVRASRDKGELKAGGDAPIDVWIMTSDGKPATVAIVRFWIGSADAKGTIKAKADIEDPKQPNHWHTHAEVPAPLTPDAKLWVEVETNQNTKAQGSFDLKR